MGSRFLKISQEHRVRCEQIVFPGGFFWTKENKVHIPEVSILYRLAGTEKDAEASDNSLMVHLCLRLQNFSDKMRVERTYQSLHGMQDPFEARYLARWNDDPLHKPRLSLYRRKINIDDLAADYGAGKSLRELAAKYGVDRKTVALQLRKAAVELRLPGCNVWVCALGQ